MKNISGTMKATGIIKLILALEKMNHLQKGLLFFYKQKRVLTTFGF